MKKHMNVAIKTLLGQGQLPTLKCIDKTQQMNSERQDSPKCHDSLPKVLLGQVPSTMRQLSLRIGRH